MRRQAHADVWQAVCVSTAGTTLQNYKKPAGYLNSNLKQLDGIWYVVILSYDLTDLRHFEKIFCKAHPCNWFGGLSLLLYPKVVINLKVSLH